MKTMLLGAAALQCAAGAGCTAAAGATLREEGRALDERSFRAAVQGGDLRLCTLYLDAGVKVNNPGRYIVETYNHDTAISTRYPSEGSGFYIGREVVEPILHTACLGGHAEVVSLLLARGYDLEVKGSLGRTALHVAVSAENTSVCTLLLDRGCDVAARDNKGNTPLMLAEGKDALRAVHRRMLDLLPNEHA